MTEQLSLWSLIANATVLVQGVMALLFIASMMSWVMIVQRGLYLRSASRNLRDFEDNFWSGVDLNELYHDSGAHGAAEGLASVFRAGYREFNRLTQQSNADPDAVMEGAERSMRVALSREEEKLNRNLPFLASVASVSPYIGLFGTVWGDYEFLSWVGERSASYVGDCRTRYFRGPNCYCYGIVCCHPRGIGIQPLFCLCRQYL